MADQTNQPATTDTSNLVSWQSAYWGLVPLAINVMVQPSGRICGFDSRWRFYLRSSPIVCAVDLVALLLRFIVLLFRGHTFAEAMGYTLESRELHFEADPVGVQAIEKVPVLRFIIFVFTLLQAVKLLSCTGIPWTQTWAFFYLIPWCVYEVLGILGKRLNSVTTRRLDRRREMALTSLDINLGFLAVAAQWLAIGYAVDLLIHPFVFPQFDENSATLPVFIYYELILISLALMVFISCLASATSHNIGRRRGQLGLLLLFTFCIYFNLYFLVQEPWMRYTIPFEANMILLGTLWGLSFGFGLISLRVSIVKREVFLLTAENPTGKESGIAVHNFLVFIYLFAFSLSAYAFRFDSRETFKPDWANVFG